MTRYFTHDLESDKLHIHTGGKADWQSLPAEQRDEIKRNCLWSRTRNCWISKARADRTYFLLKTLASTGFEDRGKEGERLSSRTRSRLNRNERPSEPSVWKIAPTPQTLADRPSSNHLTR